jgi:hypothetical protein
VPPSDLTANPLQFGGAIKAGETGATGVTELARFTITAATAGTYKLSFVPADTAAGTVSNETINFDSFKEGSYEFGTVQPPSYTLTISTNPSAGGTVSASPLPGTDGKYPDGEIVTLTASANPGYNFSSWSGDASGGATSVQVTMNGNMSVTANFVAIPPTGYSLTIHRTPSNGGNVSANPPPGNDGKYASGDVVTLTATPSQGYEFVNWTGAVSGSTTTTQVTMNSDKTITANFQEDDGGDWHSMDVNRTVNYYNCWEREGSVEVPGASSVRLVLDGFVWDSYGQGYDMLYTGEFAHQTDDYGVVYGVMGSYDVYDSPGGGQHTTAGVSGNTIRLLLDSDATYTGSFTIRRVEYQGNATGSVQFDGPLFTGQAEDECEIECSSSCPPGNNVCYDVDTKIVRSFGKVAASGEAFVTLETENAGLYSLMVPPSSKVWRVSPDASFDQSLTVEVPWVDTTPVDELTVWYFGEETGFDGWFLGSNIEGWLVPDSLSIVQDENGRRLQFQVNHGGVFQVGKAADFDLTPSGIVQVEAYGSKGRWMVIASVAFGLLLCLSLAIRPMRRQSS